MKSHFKMPTQVNIFRQINVPELLNNLVMNRFVFIASLRVENVLRGHGPFVMVFANVQQEMKVQ